MSFSPNSTPSQQRGMVLFSLILLIIIIAACVALAVYMVHLDKIVREKFEGQRWEIPAKVYARPLELFVGAELSPEDLKSESRRKLSPKACGRGTRGTSTIAGLCSWPTPTISRIRPIRPNILGGQRRKRRPIRAETLLQLYGVWGLSFESGR